MADRQPALAHAAQRKHEAARDRAADAIRRLDREREPISFKAVAARAGVSRQWLYTQPDLRAEIERLRQQHADSRPPLPAAEQASRASLRERIAHLLGENRRLHAEIADLKAELAVAYGRQRAVSAFGPCDLGTAPESE